MAQFVLAPENISETFTMGMEVMSELSQHGADCLPLMEIMKTLSQGGDMEELMKRLYDSGKLEGFMEIYFRNAKFTKLLGRTIKEGKMETSDERIVSSGFEVMMETQMIQHVQPKTMSVSIPATVPTPPHLEQLMEQLSLHFSGDLGLHLNHSYLCYEPSDKVVTGLTKSRREPEQRCEIH